MAETGLDLMKMVSVVRDHEQEKAREALTKLGEWRAKYPAARLYYAVIDGVLFVGRPATEKEWSRFEEQSALDQAAAQVEFVIACLLTPGRDVVTEMVEARPLLLLKLSEQCLRISGFDRDYDFKRA